MKLAVVWVRRLFKASVGCMLGLLVRTTRVGAYDMGTTHTMARERESRQDEMGPQAPSGARPCSLRTSPEALCPPASAAPTSAT